jgi:hypothetical protein
MKEIDAETQFVKALCYKPVAQWFNYPWDHSGSGFDTALTYMSDGKCKGKNNPITGHDGTEGGRDIALHFL